MGSLAQAKMVGFVCRVCIRITRKVVHIYGVHGTRLKLEQKMNYLEHHPVDPFDNYPKFVCRECVDMICLRYEAAMRFEERRKKGRKRHGRSVFSRDDEDSEATTSTGSQDLSNLEK